MGTLIDLVQVLGLPLALIALYISQRDSRRSNDLQAALQLSESFRGKWESGWRAALRELERRAAVGEAPGPDLVDELYNMLNWVDWLGCLIQSGALVRPRTVLIPLSQPIHRIVDAGREVVEDQEREFGADHWSGLRTAERYLTEYHYRRNGRVLNNPIQGQSTV